MTTRKQLAVSASILAALCVSVSAVPVTYQVNLSVQEALGNFVPGNGDTVLVAGNWDNWATTNTMSVSGNPNVYTITLDQTAGSYPNYKFVINPFGNSSGASLKWESPATFGGNNRWFQIPAGGTNLPVVYYSDQTTVPNASIPVKFQVDMSVQAALGHFDTNSDTVIAAGEFNLVSGSGQWATDFMLTNVPGGTLYSGTWVITNISPGATVNYKFVMNTFATGQQWEANGVGPNGANNRQFALPNAATNLPPVFFNNVTSIYSLVATQVTFVVDMSVPIARGTFDPVSGTVTVAGDPINSWSPSVSYLTNSATDTNVWANTFLITNTVGNPVNYKFTLNSGGTWENNNVGPNGAQDRQFIFPGIATNLGKIYFNNIGDLGPITNTPSGGALNLTWLPGPLVRVQTATSLLGPWQDIPETLGLDNLSTNEVNRQFFRLKGP